MKERKKPTYQDRHRAQQEHPFGSRREHLHQPVIKDKTAAKLHLKTKPMTSASLTKPCNILVQVASTQKPLQGMC